MFRGAFVSLLLLGSCARVATAAKPLTYCEYAFNTCGAGRVIVETSLSPGTRLLRDECDDVCGSLMCPSEPKSCWVVEEPLGGKAVMCQSEADPRECPIDAGVLPPNVD